MNNDNRNFDSRRKVRPAIDVSTMVYGKVPPQAKDLEEAVLGAILIDSSVFELASEILTQDECFYVDAHQRIFKACKQLFMSHNPIDVLMVVEQLKKNEELDIVGGPYYIVRLTNAVVSTANIESHCMVILQKFVQREVIRICGEGIGDGYEDSTNAYDLVSDTENKLSKILSGNERNKYSVLQQALIKTMAHTERLRLIDSHITGIQSGFKDLDFTTHGWQNTDLIILAARPAVGKTAFALNLARHASDVCPVGFFSLEMSELQLTQRLLSAQAEVFMDSVISGQLTDEQMYYLEQAQQVLNEKKIYIDDTPALNIFELRSKARKWKNKHSVGLIIVDYLQLMSGMNERNQNREQEISTISRSLKALAKELNIPVIALSQLSRAVENRSAKEKIPQLSDLRESGAIEQDADMVMFMYRPEYYEITSNEHGESTKGETHIKIAKHRNGSLDTIKLTAKLQYQKFVDYQAQPFSHAAVLGSNWKPVSNVDKDVFD